MSYVAPEKGRVKIVPTSNRLELVIPGKRNWLVILFMSAWLGGWYFGETSAINSILHSKSTDGPSGFLIFWLIGWSIGGCWVLYSIIRSLFSTERISLTSNTLIIKQEIFNFGVSKEYDLSSIIDIRVSPMASLNSSFQNAFAINNNLGVISFDYGAKTINFGSSIEEAEAREIISMLKANYSFRTSPTA